MTITVANLKDVKEGIRCDRVSMLGNPFHMETESSRLLVVKTFREYLSAIAIDEEEPAIVASRLSAIHEIPISNTWKRPTHRQFIGELNRVYKITLIEDVTLLCWCAPLPCHCHVVENYINWRKNKNAVLNIKS